MNDQCEESTEDRVNAHFENRHGFHSIRVGNMRTDAKIDHRATTVHGRRRAIRNLIRDDMNLERIILWPICNDMKGSARGN